jgi:hypothetical protein
MAIKFTLEYSSLHITATRQKLASLSLSSDPSALLQFVNLKTSSSYVDLNAILFLDAETKNLYFSSQYDSPQVQVVSIADVPVLDIQPNKSDSVGVLDLDQVKDIGKGISDTATLSENLQKSILFIRDFTDSYGFTDSESLATGLGKEEGLAMSESDVKQVGITKSDTANISEIPVLLFNTSKADSVSMSEIFSRTVVFSRSFTDAVSLDDLASATDPLQTDNLLDKDNIATLTEELNYSASFIKSDSFSFSDSDIKSFSSAKTDSVSVAETSIITFNKPFSDSSSLLDSEVISFDKGLSDTLGISESISVLFIPGAASSVLNTQALNTSVLN